MKRMKKMKEMKGIRHPERGVAESKDLLLIADYSLFNS